MITKIKIKIKKAPTLHMMKIIFYKNSGDSACFLNSSLINKFINNNTLKNYYVILCYH